MVRIIFFYLVFLSFEAIAQQEKIQEITPLKEKILQKIDKNVSFRRVHLSFNQNQIKVEKKITITHHRLLQLVSDLPYQYTLKCYKIKNSRNNKSIYVFIYDDIRFSGKAVNFYHWWIYDIENNFVDFIWNLSSDIRLSYFDNDMHFNIIGIDYETDFLGVNTEKYEVIKYKVLKDTIISENCNKHLSK